jgi:hypothetical protein
MKSQSLSWGHFSFFCGSFMFVNFSQGIDDMFALSRKDFQNVDKVPSPMQQTISRNSPEVGRKIRELNSYALRLLQGQNSAQVLFIIY